MTPAGVLMLLALIAAAESIYKQGYVSVCVLSVYVNKKKNDIQELIIKSTL